MQVNKTVTITAGTPINLATLSAVAPLLADVLFAKSAFIQMAIGGTGVGYVMDGVCLGRIPAHTNSSDLSMQLQAATATVPGGAYSKTVSPGRDDAIDLSKLWVDVSADSPVVISFDLRV